MVTFMSSIVTSIVAAARGQRDIVVGSDLTNSLGVLGMVVLVSPNPISVSLDLLWVDVPMMTVVASLFS